MARQLARFDDRLYNRALMIPLETAAAYAVNMKKVTNYKINNYGQNGRKTATCV